MGNVRNLVTIIGGCCSRTVALKLLPVPDGTGGQGQALPLQGRAIKQ